MLQYDEYIKRVDQKQCMNFYCVERKKSVQRFIVTMDFKERDSKCTGSLEVEPPPTFLHSLSRIVTGCKLSLLARAFFLLSLAV